MNIVKLSKLVIRKSRLKKLLIFIPIILGGAILVIVAAGASWIPGMRKGRRVIDYYLMVCNKFIAWAQ